MTARFQRMVVALPQSKTGMGAIEMTVNLATRLGLDLIGSFVEGIEGEKLASLALREFRPSQGWQPIEISRLAHDLNVVAQQIQQDFEQIVRKYARTGHFDFLRVAQQGALFERLQPTDILALLEPSYPLERITHQFTDLVRTALEGKSALMLVPKEPTGEGPLVAIISGLDDPALAMALSVAATAREPLIVMLRDGGNRSIVSRLAQETSVSVELVTDILGQASSELLLRRALEHHPRLIMIERKRFGSDPLSLLASQKAALLLM
jgi:hypothetical protein